MMKPVDQYFTLRVWKWFVAIALALWFFVYSTLFAFTYCANFFGRTVLQMSLITSVRWPATAMHLSVQRILIRSLPVLPHLLQQTPPDLPSSSGHSMSSQKPLPAVMNHLYIQKGCSSQSMVALSSTDRFRSKYVTAVFYKS